MADGSQTETRAMGQTELDVNHMQQWPTNWQDRLPAHYEMLETSSVCVHPVVPRARKRPL